MKKIYTVVAAVVFLSFSAISQQNSTNVSYANNGVKIIPNASEQMYIVGNPTKGTIILQISNPQTTKYELSLYNINGIKVNTMLYNHPSGVSTKQINIAGLPGGTYFLVATSNTYRKTLQVMIL